MPSTGSKSTEFKLTAATGALGVLGVLAEMLRGGTGMSDLMQIAILICITVIGISYNVSRGLAKYEHVPADAEPPNGASSEFKLTMAGAGAGALPLLMEMIQGRESVGDRVSVTLLGCVTALIVSYNIGQGLSKYEHRGDASSASAGAPGVPPAPGS